MFAVFFLEGMDPFYQNIASYPTVFFTFFLLLSMLYWLVAVLGLVDIDALDVDLPEPDADIGQINALAGLMMKFGLNGVPATLIITLISLIGWLLCYYSVHFFVRPLESVWMQFGLGSLVLLASLYLSTMLTAQIIKPLRKFFTSETTSNKSILGKVLIVRTSRVDENFGEAMLNDGGAGLMLKIRCDQPNSFKQGDRVVAYEYLNDKNVYRVVSEDEFLGNA